MGIVELALEPEEGGDAVAGAFRIRQCLGLVDRLQYAPVLIGPAGLRQLRDRAPGGGSIAGKEQVLGVRIDPMLFQIEASGHVQRADLDGFAFFLRLLLEFGDLRLVEDDLGVGLALDHRLERAKCHVANRAEAGAAVAGRAHGIAKHQVVVARGRRQCGPAFGSRGQGLTVGDQMVVAGDRLLRQRVRTVDDLCRQPLVFCIARGEFGLRVLIRSGMCEDGQQQARSQHG